MLTLLIKDFKLMFSEGRGRAKGFLRTLFSLIVTLIFIALEIFLFSEILKRIQNYSDAPIAFVRLFLLVLSVLMTAGSVLRAKKLFFNEQDIQQLANHPIENSKLILSKMIFLVFLHFTSALMFEYPVFVAYGMILHKSAWFYYKALFYPLIAGILEIGIALLLVYPVWILLQYLKKHVVLEFVLSVALLFGLAYPYSRLLNVFVGLVANNELNALFSESSIALIRSIGENAVPLNFLTDTFLYGGSSKLFLFLSISGGVFLLGLSLTIYNFHRVRNIAATSRPSKRVFTYRRTTPLAALIKKEVLLLTKNPDYIFSFSGLLFVQPFLMFLIVRAMNTIFTSGTLLYYITLFPNFVALIDVFLIIMVTLIINSGANRYIDIEERTIKNLKTIPVDFRLQLTVKLLIPYAMSALFLILSVAILWISGTVSLLTALFALLLTLVVVFVFDVISMREELCIRHGKKRSTFLSTLFSYVLPFAYVALVMLLSFLGFPLVVMYLLGVLLFLLLGLPQLWKVHRNMGNWFMELEAIN